MKQPQLHLLRKILLYSRLLQLGVIKYKHTCLHDSGNFIACSEASVTFWRPPAQEGHNISKSHYIFHVLQWIIQQWCILNWGNRAWVKMQLPATVIPDLCLLPLSPALSSSCITALSQQQLDCAFRWGGGAPHNYLVYKQHRAFILGMLGGRWHLANAEINSNSGSWTCPTEDNEIGNSYRKRKEETNWRKSLVLAQKYSWSPKLGNIIALNFAVLCFPGEMV